MKRADEALYRAKEAGRNQVQSYDGYADPAAPPPSAPDRRRLSSIRPSRIRRRSDPSAFPNSFSRQSAHSHGVQARRLWHVRKAMS